MSLFSRIRKAWPYPVETTGRIDQSGVAQVAQGIPSVERWVDVPVVNPQTGSLTTAWSNGVQIIDAGTPLDAYWMGDADVERLWAEHPHVRKVVDFIARNVASIPLHLYRRVSDTDREHVTTGDIAHCLTNPAPFTTPYRFWRAVIADGLLYDRWACLKQYDAAGRLFLQRIPARRFRIVKDGFDQPKHLKVLRNDGWYGESWKKVKLADVIFDHGYAPDQPGLSPMRTLANLLAETDAAAHYRRQVWANGLRAEHWLEIPPEARDNGFDAKRFEAEYQARFVNNGPRAGGAPLLEDGIKLHELKGFSAQDMQDMQSRQLTAVEVAAAFHVPPELVGASKGTYSNVREFRESLYQDALGPYITAWEQAVNQLVAEDAHGEAGNHLYIEAVVESKLRGSFETQARYLQTATGAPYLLRSEARARLNLPEVPGFNEPITPLNVLIGRQASPTDSGSQNWWHNSAEPLTKAGDDAGGLSQSDKRRLERLLANDIEQFAREMELSLLPDLITGGDNALNWLWDAARYNNELAAILRDHMTRISNRSAERYIRQLNVEGFTATRMDGWIRQSAINAAGHYNDQTLEGLQRALAEQDYESELRHVFEIAGQSRAERLSQTLVTDFTNFGGFEVAQQGGLTHKTWITMGDNEVRDSHAALAGVTVPLGYSFPHGGRWPGYIRSAPQDRIGCRCWLSFSTGQRGVQLQDESAGWLADAELASSIPSELVDVSRGWPTEVQAITEERWQHIVYRHGPNSRKDKSRFNPETNIAQVIRNGIARGYSRAEIDDSGDKLIFIDHNSQTIKIVLEYNEAGDKWWIKTAHPTRDYD